jgi:hypothetical protein
MLGHYLVEYCVLGLMALVSRPRAVTCAQDDRRVRCPSGVWGFGGSAAQGYGDRSERYAESTSPKFAAFLMAAGWRTALVRQGEQHNHGCLTMIRNCRNAWSAAKVSMLGPNRLDCPARTFRAAHQWSQGAPLPIHCLNFARLHSTRIDSRALTERAIRIISGVISRRWCARSRPA